MAKYIKMYQGSIPQFYKENKPTPHTAIMSAESQIRD